MSLEPPAPQDIVIIGATGDLSRRKLLPALYNLAAGGLLPAGGQIVGLARSDLSDDGFRELARDAVKEFSRSGFDEKLWGEFARRLRFVHLDDEGYEHLAWFTRR